MLMFSELLEFSWYVYKVGFYVFGYEVEGFYFDNEGLCYKYWFEVFVFVLCLVSNGEYFKFMVDGGYFIVLFWFFEGWVVVNERGWVVFLYWC